MVGDGAGAHQLVEREYTFVGHPHGQRGAGASQRRQDSVEAGAVGETYVDVEGRVVEAAAAGPGQALGPSGTRASAGGPGEARDRLLVAM